jgi:hypothetical protein
VWPHLTPAQQVRYLQGLADYEFQNQDVIADGFSSHSEFLIQKYRKYVQATKGRRPEMYSLLSGTKLFHLEPQILPELKRLIENPSEDSLIKLRHVCSQRTPSENPPLASELNAGTIHLAEGNLERGDIYMARALVMIVDHDCLHSEDDQGPVEWLGSTLICRYPEILVEAFAEERPSAKTIRQVMEFESPKRWRFCDLEESGVAKTFLQTKVDLIAKVQTKNPIEDDVVETIMSRYKKDRTRY